jgi:hypothetical protein
MGYIHQDNCLVSGGKSRADFFEISFRELDENLSQPQIVSLRRYSVPGRYSHYDFDYAPSLSSGVGDRIRYFSDVGDTLPIALNKLRKDLDKDAVVNLLKNSSEIYPYLANILLQKLLSPLGRGTKAFRAVKSIVDKRNKEKAKKLVKG